MPLANAGDRAQRILVWAQVQIDHDDVDRDLRKALLEPGDRPNVPQHSHVLLTFERAHETNSKHRVVVDDTYANQTGSPPLHFNSDR